MNDMIRLLGKRLVIQECEKPSAGGIILVSPTKDRFFRGVVLAIGEGIEPIKGEKVLVDRFTLQEVQWDGSPAFIVNAEEVIGIDE